MPNDDIQYITMKVTEHANINTRNGDVYVDWFDIQVYQEGIHICDITVHSHTEDISYDFISYSFMR